MKTPRIITGIAVSIVLLCLAACHQQSSMLEQHFDLRGKVLRLDRDAGTITVQHEAIPGYMAAMTMDYPIKDSWVFDVVKPGQTIQAKLVTASTEAWLQDIVVMQEANPVAGSPEAEEAGLSALRKQVPDFALINQDGKRIHLHQYRGTALLLTFIYTRCPLPNYCPLMSRNFAEILHQVQSDPSLPGSLRLLTVSIDPDNDTPAVLRAYGLEHAGGASSLQQWEFATGSNEEIRKVADYFGLRYWTQGGQIQHSLVTVLIDAKGKVVRIFQGNQWQPDEVLAEIKRLASQS